MAGTLNVYPTNLDDGTHATPEDLAKAKRHYPSCISAILCLTLLAPETEDGRSLTFTREP